MISFRFLEFAAFFDDIKRAVRPQVLTYVHALCQVVSQFARSTRPAKSTSSPLVLGTMADLALSKPELIIENALLRQQLIVLRRQVKRPELTQTDRIVLVFLASKLRTWKSTLLIGVKRAKLSPGAKYPDRDRLKFNLFNPIYHQTARLPWVEQARRESAQSPHHTPSVLPQ